MSFMDRVKKVTAPAVNAGAKAMLKVGLRVLSAPELGVPRREWPVCGADDDKALENGLWTAQ